MARLAESSSVGKVESKFGELRERLDMVSMNPYSTALARPAAARLTRPIIAGKHRLAPRSVFWGIANLEVDRRDAALPAWVLVANGVWTILALSQSPSFTKSRGRHSNTGSAFATPTLCCFGQRHHALMAGPSRNIVAHQELPYTPVRYTECSTDNHSRSTRKVQSNYLVFDGIECRRTFGNTILEGANHRAILPRLDS